MSGHQYRMAFLTTASSMLMHASAHVRQLWIAPQVPTSIVPALTRAACARAPAQAPAAASSCSRAQDATARAASAAQWTSSISTLHAEQWLAMRMYMHAHSRRAHGAVEEISMHAS